MEGTRQNYLIVKLKYKSPFRLKGDLFDVNALGSGLNISVVKN
jgi:hypothetical protein